MRIRSANQCDVEAIAVVHVESWRATYRGLVPHDFFAGLSVEDRKAVWEEVISTAAADPGVFVLEDEDVLIGFCHWSPSRDDDAGPDVGEVTSIYLLSAYWRRGGGSLLMEAAVEALRSAGYATATLWVLDGNASAQPAGSTSTRVRGGTVG